ncbi:hypothetical protein [Streptomyces lancefieldiae]|uniref:Uncharacterized protein n=1 Tax=Streptomyces lancefieldiae TaxID=3075520 RepID=A0ABU3AWR3_9ACTN|nr:hypothetical protein [Streptomyces sp. DSM 40712]MDT0614459.1 hypothetical protein [Streptomyces sp. DSM 40712]
MTTAIMTRSAARTAVAAINPDYWCDSCSAFHTGPCATIAHRQLGDLLERMAREADSRIPSERRARRTLQEMMPGYERQPVLTLHRPVMAGDRCPLCDRWQCDPSNCPPGAAPAPAPAAASGQWQCDTCGNWFGVTDRIPVTGWTCSACAASGR